jgi:hypothetical protein
MAAASRIEVDGTVSSGGLPAPGTGRSTTADALRRLLRSGERPSAAALAEAIRPVVPIGHPTGVPVDGPLGALLPSGHLPAGAVVTLDGEPGTGRTSVGLELLAATTATGAWAAVVDPRGVVGGRAAEEAGVDLARVAVVRGVTADRWPTVVAALLDGVAVVLAEAPSALPVADARRLAARARERRATLVVLGAWPERAGLRLRAVGATWYGLDEGEGLLAHRLLTVEGDDRAGRARRVDLVGPGPGVAPAAWIGPHPAGPVEPLVPVEPPGPVGPVAVPVAG